MGGGAGGRIRTRDPLITSQVLYQLSYTGETEPALFPKAGHPSSFFCGFAQGYALSFADQPHINRLIRRILGDADQAFFGQFQNGDEIHTT